MRLTDRDYDVLKYLADQGVASSRQLSEGFFPNMNTFHRRTSKLIRAGLIESVPLSTMKEFSQMSYFRTATDLLGASRSDIWKYKIYRLGKHFKKKWPSTGKLSDVKMWRHQLMVNELRAVFEKRYPDALFLNDPQVMEEWRLFQNTGARDCSDVPIPDLTLRTNGKQIAIEIERHRKKDIVYYERFQQFERSKYTHVIYYCESEAVFKAVSKLAHNFRRIAVARFGSIGEVYRLHPGWVKLDEFLELDYARRKSY